MSDLEKYDSNNNQSNQFYKKLNNQIDLIKKYQFSSELKIKEKVILTFFFKLNILNI